MNLLEISPGVIINVEKITAIKTQMVEGKPTMAIIVDGTPYLSERPSEELFAIFRSLGLNTQHWAGR